MLQLPVETLLALVGGRVERAPTEGRQAQVFHRIATLQAADAACIAFLANPRYRAQLSATAAGCVLVSEAALPLASTDAAGALVVAVPDAYRAYARLSQWWAANSRPPAAPGIHPSAFVEPGALVHPEARIEAFARVGPGAVIAAGACIGSYSFVGAGATIGEGSRLAARVTVMDGCHLGDRCLLHPGVVIGADGFGFAPSPEGWVKIEQLGGVRIGDEVEIGANTCIDRGALDDTVIEDGVKLDNLIQVGHNVRIGAGSAMAGCVGIAGSAIIGKRCTVGGGAIILGHLELVDDVHISAATVVSRSIRKPGLYSGVYPFDDNASWEKNAATLRQLHQLRDRLRRLERLDVPQP